MTMGQRLVRLRNERCLSQDALAAALGVSRQSVSKWETDASIPDLDRLVKLSELYEVSLDELVKGKKREVRAAPALLSGIIQLYRDKAYLLGWLLVAQGFLRLYAWFSGQAGYYQEMGWAATLNFALLLAYVPFLAVLRAGIGLWIVLRGRQFSGQFRWRHLGWIPVFLGLFGMRSVRLIQTGLLEDLLSKLSLVFWGQAERVAELLPLAFAESLPKFLLLAFGFAIILTGHKKRPPE